MRTKVSEPTYLSFMILNARAENGASSALARDTARSEPGSTPSTAATSLGAGR